MFIRIPTTTEQFDAIANLLLSHNRGYEWYTGDYSSIKVKEEDIQTYLTEFEFVMQALEDKRVSRAFQTLMGENGYPFIREIKENGTLSKRSYDTICDNVFHNSKESVLEHFGIVQWYYFQYIRKNAA